MIPIPFVNYIPKLFERDNKLNALSDKADAHLEEWKQDIISIGTFRDPVRINTNLLDELDILLNAGVQNQDSDRIKREKITSAILGHKRRGLWVEDIKPKIDAIVGEDAQLVTEAGQDDFIIVGDGTTPSAYFWSVLGGSALSTEYGIRLVGEGDEDALKGVILIDVDSSILTADEVEQIKLTIIDSVPTYYVVKLGYMSAGVFTPYANGQIG